MLAKNKRKTHRAKTAHKKATKKHSRRVNSSPFHQQPAYYPEKPTQTYEEVVIKNIVNNSNKSNNVPDEAYLLSSAMSSMSTGMKELHYKSGISIGRALYKMNSESKSYTFPEESVADLVSFFESAGYKNITCRAYPESVEIKIHEKRGPSVGTSLHSFEAGIISGFLSAANQRYVGVVESECTNSDGQYCKFTTNYTNSEQNNKVELDKIASHITENISSKHGNAGLANAYYLLSSSILLDKSYLDSMKSIASYMGKSVSEKLSVQRKGKMSFHDITNTIRMLHLGNPIIVDTKPFRMKLIFDKVTARREFVDLSLAFVNGLLSEKLGDAVAVEKNANGLYVIDIRQKKALYKNSILYKKS